jgi:signal transduction histidine kinase
MMSLKLMENERIGELNEEQKKLLENIRDDSRRLLKITGELLDIAQIESGNIQLNISHINPALIVDQAVRSAQGLADLKNISIEVKISPELTSVYADADKASWVLLNFLTNAIKYSTENAKILLSVIKIENKIEFAVQDFGKGIEKKYLNRLFEKFFQIPGTAIGGTGMGLAISKEIIEKHRGTIYVESEFGKGSRFSFKLADSL